MKLTVMILVLLATIAAAADEKPDDVIARLGSKLTSERAWGAYLAGKNGVEDAIPKLVDLIRTVPHHKDKEGNLVVRAAFDALIRLKAAVRPKVLEPHLRARFQTQAMILFAPHAGNHPELLLRLLDAQTGRDFGPFGVAVGNLLLRHRVPGFAPRLLRELKFELSVMVFDSGFGGRGSSSRMLVRSGDGRLDVPEGFPPTVIYRLSTGKKAGAVLLVDGPDAVYWTRTERTGTRIGFGSSTRPHPRDDLARAWLCRLAKVSPKTAPLRGFTHTSVTWSDDAGYVQHVAAQRDAILARYWKLVSALVTSEALALDEARALKPEVTITVEDKRKLNEGKLPAIPPAPKRPPLPGEEPETRDAGDAPVK